MRVRSRSGGATAGRRRAMTAAFMPDGVRFNGQRNERMLAEEDLAHLAEGEPWRNDRRNPVVYRRTTAQRICRRIQAFASAVMPGVLVAIAR